MSVKEFVAERYNCAAIDRCGAKNFSDHCIGESNPGWLQLRLPLRDDRGTVPRQYLSVLFKTVQIPRP
jgi:hypothetical protein